MNSIQRGVAFYVGPSRMTALDAGSSDVLERGKVTRRDNVLASNGANTAVSTYWQRVELGNGTQIRLIKRMPRRIIRKPRLMSGTFHAMFQQMW